MSERKSNGAAVDPPSPRETVCILEVRTMLDDLEVEIYCQRIDGVDRVFSTNMDWLCAARPSESTLASSVEILLPDIIAKCLHFVGEPADVRAGVLSKERVEAIIGDVCLEMDQIKEKNEVSRDAEIVTKAARLGLSPEASNLGGGTWIARCPGTNHTLELQPKQNLFYCGYCRAGGGIVELDEFAARRRSTATGFIGGRTLP